jgi:hypothetical protein
MKQTTYKFMTQQVDAASKELMEEFRQHAEKCRRDNPEMTNINFIFQAWAIQKIASLQCLCVGLVARVYELEAHTRN